jgi:hypothetical protein
MPQVMFSKNQEINGADQVGIHSIGIALPKPDKRFVLIALKTPQ